MYADGLCALSTLCQCVCEKTTGHDLNHFLFFLMPSNLLSDYDRNLYPHTTDESRIKALKGTFVPAFTKDASHDHAWYSSSFCFFSWNRHTPNIFAIFIFQSVQEREFVRDTAKIRPVNEVSLNCGASYFTGFTYSGVVTI